MRRGGASGPCCASARRARQAYSAFAEIFMSPPIPAPQPPLPPSCFSELAAIQRVQPTLGLGLSGPSARPLVLAGLDAARGRPATDRRVSLILQRDVRQAIGHGKCPEVALRP